MWTNGWMGGGVRGRRRERKKREKRRRNKAKAFLKKSKAPLLDGQIAKGQSMLRGRYEEKKITALYKSVITETSTSCFANSSYKQY